MQYVLNRSSNQNLKVLLKTRHFKLLIKPLQLRVV
jgi:hypothetical protein